MTITTVPIIDIAPFLAGDARGKQRVASAVGEACRDIGFFAVSGHGVPDATIEGLRNAAHTFFELPEDEKLRCVHPVKDTPRGHRVFAGESLGRTVVADATPDLKEFYHYGQETWPEEPYYTGPEGQRYFIPNIWPDHPTELKPAALAYYREMEILDLHLMRIAALALELPETFFDDKIDRHVSAMRLNYYPLLDAPPPPGHIRAGEHTDYGMLTILMGEDQPGGLQVRTRKGEWIDVETRPEFFVVNIGDLLMRWTNDVWISNMHRVVNPPEGTRPTRGRLSIGFFQQPNYDAVIECIETCAGPDNPPRYPPVVSGAYRNLKYEQGNSVNQAVGA